VTTGVDWSPSPTPPPVKGGGDFLIDLLTQDTRMAQFFIDTVGGCL